MSTMRRAVEGSRRHRQPRRFSRIDDRAAVRVEALGLGQRQRRRAERGQRLRRAGHDRGALQEVGDAEAAREARRARGRQHVVGAGDIVADRLGRVAADEDRAGMRDLLAQRLGRLRLHRQLDVLGARCGRRSARSVAEVAHQDDAAIVAPARAGDLGARHRLQLRIDGLRDLLGERRIVGDQHRLRGGIVLGLRQQVGGDPGRIVVPVGDHQDLRRAGDQVDADLAEHAALGGGDIGIARAGDLVDRLDRVACRRRAPPPPARRRCARSRRRRRSRPPA